MDFEHAVRDLTCEFPCLGLHHFLFDDQWFNAETFAGTGMSRFRWPNYNKAVQKIRAAAKTFGGTVDPIAVQQDTPARAWQMITSASDAVIDSQGQPVAVSQATARLGGKEAAGTSGNPLYCILELMRNIESCPEAAREVLSDDGRVVAAALFYVQSCFTLADSLVEYCKNPARPMQFSMPKHNLSTALDLIGDLDESGRMILTDYRSRLGLLQLLFSQVRPRQRLAVRLQNLVAPLRGALSSIRPGERVKPRAFLAGLLHFAAVAALASAVFFLFIKPVQKPLPYPSQPRQEPLLADTTGFNPKPVKEPQEVHPVTPVQEKSPIDESSSVNEQEIPPDVETEPGTSESVASPKPPSAMIPQSDFPQVAEPDSRPDTGEVPTMVKPPAGAQQDSGLEEQAPAGETQTSTDTAHRPDPRKEKNDLSADSPEEPPQHNSPAPEAPANIEPPARRQYDPPPVLVTNLMDYQDWRLLNKYLEKGRSYLHYSWGNRLSGFLFEITPKPAYGRSKICRDVTLHARVDTLGGRRQTVYAQKITCCRSSRGIWTPQLPENICAVH